MLVDETVQGSRPAVTIQWFGFTGADPEHVETGNDFVVVDRESWALVTRHAPTGRAGEITNQRVEDGRMVAAVAAASGEATSQDFPVAMVAVHAGRGGHAHPHPPAPRLQRGRERPGSAGPGSRDVRGLERKGAPGIVDLVITPQRVWTYYIGDDPPYWLGMVSRSPAGTTTIRYADVEFFKVTSHNRLAELDALGSGG